MKTTVALIVFLFAGLANATSIGEAVEAYNTSKQYVSSDCAKHSATDYSSLLANTSNLSCSSSTTWQRMFEMIAAKKCAKNLLAELEATSETKTEENDLLRDYQISVQSLIEGCSVKVAEFN